MINTQQNIISASKHNVEKSVLETNTLQQTSAGTSLHKIRKIIKNNSVEYFCNECNTHYARLSWVLEDHPSIDVTKFSVIDLRKEDNIFS